MGKGEHQNRLIICPRCDKLGFLTRRLVGSASYYVLYATCHQFSCNGINPDYLRQYLYTGKSFEKDHNRYYEYRFVHPRTDKTLTCHVKTDVGNNTKPLKMVQEVLSDRREIRYYVGHYDPEKFKVQMNRYRTGKIRCRPNGRKWCLLQNNTVVQQGEIRRSLDQFYAQPVLDEYHYDDYVNYEGRIICDN